MCRGEKKEGLHLYDATRRIHSKRPRATKDKKYIDILAIYRRCITDILCIEEYEYDIYVRYID